jgi:hypothetical protein
MNRHRLIQSFTQAVKNWAGAAPATGMTTNPPLKRNSQSCCLAIPSPKGTALSRKRSIPIYFTSKFAENSVKVLNAGCSGYGIDQMLFNGLRESHKHKPDLVIFSFKPHDLIRVSKNFMYGRCKPKITFTGDTISVDPAVNAGLRHDSYERALNGSSLLYWYLQNEIWPNAEYYAPELYRKHCRKVYTYIYEQMATLAKERRLEVVFVKLTNSFEFRGEKTLISMAEEVFSANTAAGLSYYDMECVGREIDLDDPESDSMFYFHPTAEGHRLFADGLSELITSANRQHAPQSH